MQKVVDLLRNNCCIFIGAGIPNALGFPLWSGIANDLINFTWDKKKEFTGNQLTLSIKQELEDFVRKGKPITAITYCRDRLKEIGQEKEYQSKIISLLQNEEKCRSAKDNPVYLQLEKLLKGSRVLQTNLDRSIQTHCNFKSYANNNLPNTFQTPCLIYLHGIITDPSSWIMTTDEYNKYYQNNPDFKNFIQNVFRKNDVLFLGYSLSDKEILDQIAQANESGKQYVLVLEEIERNKAFNTVYENELKHYGILVERYNIEKEGYEAFASYLAQINSLLSPPVQPNAQGQDGSRIDE